MVKASACNERDPGSIPGSGRSLEKEMATHSSMLAWRIPWTEEPGGLQSMGLLRIGHNWASSLLCTGEGNGNPLQCSCLENPRDGGAWWAAVHGVAQSRTWLKRLSSSSRPPFYFRHSIKFSLFQEPSQILVVWCILSLHFQSISLIKVLFI